MQIYLIGPHCFECGAQQQHASLREREGRKQQQRFLLRATAFIHLTYMYSRVVAIDTRKHRAASGRERAIVLLRGRIFADITRPFGGMRERKRRREQRVSALALALYTSIFCEFMNMKMRAQWSNITREMRSSWFFHELTRAQRKEQPTSIFDRESDRKIILFSTALIINAKIQHRFTFTRRKLIKIITECQNIIFPDYFQK